MTDKDKWIKRALEARFIVAREDGEIFRFHHIDEKRKSKVYIKIKTSTHKKSGRKYFNLLFEGIKKSVLVNRVVALAFIPNPMNLAEVNHINGNKADNSVSNLEWADRSHQEKHAREHNLKSTRGSNNPNAKLTPESVVAIRKSQEISSGELAKLYGVGISTIEDIKSGKTWTHI